MFIEITLGAYLKAKPKTLSSIPNKEEKEQIIQFLQELFEKELIPIDSRFLIDLSEEKREYLRTSIGFEIDDVLAKVSF